MLINVDFTESVDIVAPIVRPKEMISVSSLGSKTLVRINSSSVGVIQECPRKAQYLLHEGWRSSNESPATLFGSAIHKGLEVFYAGKRTERKMPSFEDMEYMSYGHGIDGEKEDLLLRSTRAFIEKAAPLAALPETDKRSIQNGVWTLFQYFKTYLDDPYVALVDKDGPFVERPFTFRLYEDDETIIDYFGTIDLVVRDERSGEIIVCDHKTSSVVGADFYNRLKPNHQYTGYLLGAREAFGFKTDQFLVNCLQVKEKPKTTRGSAPHFPRQITTRDESDFAEFRDAVVESVYEYLGSRASEVWPLGHVNACAMYGGCSFLAVCSAPKSLRENILKAKFAGSETNVVK